MRRQRAGQAIFLLILVLAGIVLAGYVSLRNRQQPTITTGYLVGRTARFAIAVDPAVLPLVQQAMLNADTAVLDGLVQEGKAFTVANDRQVEVQVAIRDAHIIWLYRPQRRRSEVHCVAAEVAQVSELRIRVRARSVSGNTVLRWVHARNLRATAPGELGEPYPELR